MLTRKYWTGNLGVTLLEGQHHLVLRVQMTLWTLHSKGIWCILLEGELYNKDIQKPSSCYLPNPDKVTSCLESRFSVQQIGLLSSHSMVWNIQQIRQI